MSYQEEKRHWLEPPEWWKKFRPLRWLAIAGIAFGAYSVFYTAKTFIAPPEHAERERFLGSVADPVAFLDGLKSYDSLASVREKLDAAKVVYTVKASRPPASRKYPPRDRDTLVAAAYHHLGSEGELTLEFFNDRLYEATFVPGYPDDYAPKLTATEPRLKADRNGRAERTVGNLRLASNVVFAATDVGRSLQTRPFVIWQDQRLTTLLDEWDRRFVALPEKK